MNILQILPELNFGGVETGTVDLAKRLRKMSHKPIIVSGGGKQAATVVKLGIIHYELPVHKKSLFSIIYSIIKLKEIIKEEKVDLVHARSRVPAIIAAAASYFAEVPFITTAHGYYSKHIFSRAMCWGKFVIAISNSIGRHMVDGFKLPPERLRLIWRGVDLEQFPFREPHASQKSSYTIGMIGRLTPLKGHRFFIKSILLVLKTIPSLKVLIVGDAPSRKTKYKEELEDLVKRLGLEKNVEFIKGTQDISSVMSRLDLLVLATTVQEGFGRVIVEAFSSGVPVVATSVGGVLDIVKDGKNGILVPPSNPNEMADAILKILKNGKLKTALINEAKKSATSKFNLDIMVDKTIKVYKEALSSKRILVIKISSLGDVILAIPSLRALRERFPESKIYVLVGKKSRQVVQSCPYVDEVIVVDDNYSRGFKFLRIVKELSSYKFDMVVDLQNNKTSHLVSFLCMAPSRYGFDNGKFSFLLNHRVKFVGLGAISPVEHQAKVLGIMGVDIEDPSLELWPKESDYESIKEQLSDEWVSKKQPIVGMNISSSVKWQTKRWSLENFVKVCDELARSNIRTVLIGSKQDRELADRFMYMSKAKPINFVGRTSVLELAALIKECNIFLSGDSAPMHVAAGMRTPFIALFGPTDPKRHLPPTPADVDEEDFFLLKKDFNCMPCYKRTCLNPKCMNEITPEEVLKIIKNRLVAKSKNI